MLPCRLEAEMAAMDVQRLQLLLQTSPSRLAEESQQRRQLQADLEQVRAVCCPGAEHLPQQATAGTAGLASRCGLCSCHVVTRLPQQSTGSCRQCSISNSNMAHVAVQAPRSLPGWRCSCILLWCYRKQAHWPSAKDAACQETALVKQLCIS